MLASARSTVRNRFRLSEDYAFARPALVREKTRRLELMPGAPRHQGRSATGRAHVKTHQRQAEREIFEQAEQAYRRLQGHRAEEGGRERDTGARINRSSKDIAAWQTP